MPTNLTNNPEESGRQGFILLSWCTGAFVIAVALYPLSRFNYLLFHILIEFSSIIVSVTIFSIGWNTRKIARNDFFTLLAIAFLIVAGLDLLHTMSYKGMGIFPDAEVDPPTQFWIAARAVEAVSFLGAAFVLGHTRRMDAWSILSLYLVVGGLLTLSIWPLAIFPECMIEGGGLTPFKIISEYLICGVLLLSGVLFWMKRSHLDGQLLRMLLLSVFFSICSELTFTLYHDVYGFDNYFGHMLKIAAVLALYRALVLGAFQKPYQTLFRDLAESHQALDEELDRRRITEEELRIANQELDAFVRTASHDLRAPLTVIISGTEFLRSELAGLLTEKQSKLLETIGSQGDRMSHLLRDMLTLARIGSMDQSLEIVDPAAVTTQVIGDLQEETTLSCRIETGTMPPLLAHSSLVYQLLLNLIGNAVRYGCNPQHPVRVEGKTTATGYVFSVIDHGPGISVEERQRIFDVFYRIHGKETPGTGIGLATVQKIARYYNGRSYVEETPGGGATFRVEFDISAPSSDQTD